MDAETAKRIAENLIEAGWIAEDEPGDAPDHEGLGCIAATIQKAAEPPPPPGLYFVRSPAGHIDACLLEVHEGRAAWHEWTGSSTLQPPGEIVSGPHTREALLEAVQK